MSFRLSGSVVPTGRRFQVMDQEDTSHRNAAFGAAIPRVFAKLRSAATEYEIARNLTKLGHLTGHFGL
jgi:hypothetical protein